eukprot:1335270-Rhodomonas_salina.1
MVYGATRVLHDVRYCRSIRCYALTVLSSRQPVYMGPEDWQFMTEVRYCPSVWWYGVCGTAIAHGGMGCACGSEIAHRAVVREG